MAWISAGAGCRPGCWKRPATPRPSDRLAALAPPTGTIFVDLDGRVAALKTTDGSRAWTLVGDEIRAIGSALSATGSHRHPWIGADIQMIGEPLLRFFDEGRFVVVYVDRQSPAWQAGLRPGVALSDIGDGVSTATSADEIERLVEASDRLFFVPVGNRADLIEVPVADLQVPVAFLGSAGTGVAVVAGRSGPAITVAPGSPAAHAGLETGDIVEAIDRRAPGSVSQVDAALRSTTPRLLTINRDGRRRFVVFPRSEPTESDAR